MFGLLEHIRTRLLRRRRRERVSLAALFRQFQQVLELNNRILTAIASMHDKLGGDYIFDVQYLRTSKQFIVDTVRELIDAFDAMAPGRYPGLYSSFRDIRHKLESELERRPVLPDVMAIPFCGHPPAGHGRGRGQVHPAGHDRQGLGRDRAAGFRHDHLGLPAVHGTQRHRGRDNPSGRRLARLAK